MSEVHTVKYVQLYVYNKIDMRSNTLVFDESI